MERQARKSRPEKRTLVRWSDNLDKQVLLTIQWACAENGIKIPWAKVANEMGPSFSEGAIVQHLAKLRQRMVELNADVPPPLKRGQVTKEVSSVYATKQGRNAIANRNSATARTSTAAGVRRAIKPNRRAHKPTMSEEDSDNLPDPVLDDDDDEYDGAAKKKARRSGSKKGGERAKRYASSDDERKFKISSSPKVENPIVDDQNVAPSVKDDAGPAARTRHVKTDYTGFGNEDDDEHNEEEEEENADEGFTPGFGKGRVSLSRKYRDEGSYSPRNTASMISTPTRVVTDKIDMVSGNPQPTVFNGAIPNFYPMTPSAGFSNSSQGSSTAPFYGNGGNDDYSTSAYNTPSRAYARHFSTPHTGSSFSSSRTNSINSGLVANQVQTMTQSNFTPNNFNSGPFGNNGFDTGFSRSDHVDNSNVHSDPFSTQHLNFASAENMAFGGLTSGNVFDGNGSNGQDNLAGVDQKGYPHDSNLDLDPFIHGNVGADSLMDEYAEQYINYEQQF